jgi:hypothetical protein
MTNCLVGKAVCACALTAFFLLLMNRMLLIVTLVKNIMLWKEREGSTRAQVVSGGGACADIFVLWRRLYKKRKHRAAPATRCFPEGRKFHFMPIYRQQEGGYFNRKMMISFAYTHFTDER